MSRESLWHFSLRLAVSVLSVGVFYTAWMGAFILSFGSAGPVTRVLLWLAGPLVTAAGYAFGLVLFQWKVRPRGAQFFRNFVWPLLGCAVGAGVVFPFGPMLVVFGMFLVGALTVAIREGWPLRRSHKHEHAGSPASKRRVRRGEVSMERFEKVATLENEVQARLVDSVLSQLVRDP